MEKIAMSILEEERKMSWNTFSSSMTLTQSIVIQKIWILMILWFYQI